jgi:hypothetical protein
MPEDAGECSTVLPKCSPEKGFAMKLTKATVAGLALAANSNDKIYWDDNIPLFGVRLRKGGSKGWVFWYRLGGRVSPLRKIGLGATSAVSAAEARAEAGKLYARVRLGQDPASEKAESVVRAGETVESVIRPFLARQAKRLKPRSYAEVERHLLVQAKPFASASVGGGRPARHRRAADRDRGIGWAICGQSAAFRSSHVFRLGDARRIDRAKSRSQHEPA